MKTSFIISAFAVVLLPFTGWGQVAEFGLSGGVSPHMGAFGSIYYKAPKLNVTPVGAATFVVNMNRFSDSRLTYQLGLTAHVFSSLRNKTDNTYQYLLETIGNDGKYFRYANYVLSVAPVANFRYKLSDVSYAYGGIALGVAFSRNESNRRGADFAGTDVTYTAPDGGRGYCAGIQLGWTSRLTQRIAFNADAAFRYYHLGFKVNDANYPGGTRFSYGTIMIPVTVGIRYRMGWPKQLNYATGKMQPVKEEIHNKQQDKE